MNIAKIDYNPETNSLEVYVTGCNVRCKGCHNPSLQSFGAGTPWINNMERLTAIWLCDRVMVMGGEPQDQDPDELRKLLQLLGERFKEVWVFSGYDEWMHQDLLPYIDILKMGRYIEGVEGCEYYTHDTMCVKLASNNQRIVGGGRWRRSQ